MDYSIDYGPAFSVLNLTMRSGESILTQPGSMLSMSTGFEIKAKAGGHLERPGAMGSMKSLMTGESFFTSIFTAKRDEQNIALAPEFNGEILALDVSTSDYYLTKGAFLACSPEIKIKTEYKGFKSVIAKKGFFLMRASGHGLLFISSHGAIVRKTLAKDEGIAIDNNYVLAFNTDVHYELVKATSDLKDAVLSGEGLVNRYLGPGEVIYQTRAVERRSGFFTALINIFT